ncbi:MAG TPA: ABC-F type ribosomal protection protein [Hungateiclostridium thermocellum]|uniref:ABC transporter related protein n=1 Tax=Acetivibrio thermocellus (strain ATCC 27405 / DSM 1237 / JCM 9322 / NBRC 103400 / NCIMB 10682 / NRRL B-4536 / VPI 7372) TaxID=203119 RepID=A3DHP3_ACET2|nr:ABC-F type ribosomal protection protein [Acetivibrio thermocellus]ABN53472.1 ABC transporter related protein [Acetivibrio thermocellus ATCC 27405]UWV46850.1 ABC-F type ribosomal protection protein [Acetivibrio thermocellus]HBW27649.1 ABC-F type ribosomal protection protein [Acetivibrio thermocellus]
MLILEAHNIKKYYSDRLVIEIDDLKIYSGDKIGIIGQNGSGKTTLLNILAKEIEPDEGFVRQFCDIAYIRQFSEESICADKKLLKEFDLSQKVHQKVFSGGEKTRIKIANAFNRENLLVFADEPTANLDYKCIELLKQKLQSVESFLLISHDRNLLDSICNKIIEVRDGNLYFYNGNYSFYKKQREMEYNREIFEYEKYINEKSSIEEAIMGRQNLAKSMRKTPKRMGNSEARLHKRKTTQKQEKINNKINSLKTRLEKLEVKEKPKEVPKIKLDFSLTNPPENKVVISADKLSFSYGNKKIFDKAGFKILNGSKTALWGENGTGKSTLLNLIFEKTDKNIYIAPKVKIGYFHQDFENLDYDKSVLENVMRDSVQNQTVARTILARLLIKNDDVNKKVGCLSGGERVKVSFAKLFVSDANVLLLDEPTNYLDMSSMEALESVLCEYEGTVLFVSHDSAFVNAVADRLLVIENHTITEFEGNLDDYRQKMNETSKKVKDETEKIIIRMKMAEIAAKLSVPGTDKEALEEEYRRLAALLGNM